jgi:hypothetical protein
MHRFDAARDYGYRPATPRAGQHRLGQEQREMATQINVLDTGTETAMSLLVVLMAILAMLGIVANVAMA